MKTLKFSELTEDEKQSIRDRYARGQAKYYEIRRWKKFDKKRVDRLTSGASLDILLAEQFLKKEQDKYMVEYNPDMEEDA
jgi:hypothetical protein